MAGLLKMRKVEFCGLSKCLRTNFYNSKIHVISTTVQFIVKRKKSLFETTLVFDASKIPHPSFEFKIYKIKSGHGLYAIRNTCTIQRDDFTKRKRQFVRTLVSNTI